MAAVQEDSNPYSLSLTRYQPFPKMAPICRVTMIKVEEDKLDIALAGFKTFTQKQSKVREVDQIPQYITC